MRRRLRRHASATKSVRAASGAMPGRPRTALRGSAHRISWGFADQIVSSLTNSVLCIYIAREFGAEAFGAFSLAYATYSFALTASRGLSTDPLMVRFSGTDLARWRRAVAGSTGTATSVGLTVGACLLAVATALHGTPGSTFLALGVTLPGLLLQDSWRYAFFALGQCSRALVNDLIWAIVLVPTLFFLQATGQASVGWFVLAWGAAAAIAAAFGLLQARVAPSLAGARAWLSQHRDLASRYLAEGVAPSTSAQLRTYGIGVVAGLAAVGYVQAAATLMGPVTIVYLGVFAVVVPEAARILRSSPRRLPLLCLLVSSGLAAASLIWGVALMLALPHGIGNWLIGPIWRSAYPVVIPNALAMMGQSVSAGASVGLRVLGAARRSSRVMIVGSAGSLICVIAGAASGGAVGAMRGLAISTWIVALIWWWQFRTALKESAQAYADNWFWSSRQEGRHRKPTWRQTTVRSRAGSERAA